MSEKQSVLDRFVADKWICEEAEKGYCIGVRCLVKAWGFSCTISSAECKAAHSCDACTQH